jgi:transketolase C-terminal domain/subunit
LHIIGLRTFGESGTSEELYEKYGLSGSGITRTVKEALAPLG